MGGNSPAAVLAKRKAVELVGNLGIDALMEAAIMTYARIVMKPLSLNGKNKKLNPFSVYRF